MRKKDYLCNKSFRKDLIRPMKFLLYFFLAVLPTIVLMAYVRWRDRLRPEPRKELIIAFVLGILSVPLALIFVKLFYSLGLVPNHVRTALDSLKDNFWGAAIPEELAKLLMLLLFFKWRGRQDELMDGIVYAVCVGLGFATLENLLYIFGFSISYPSAATETMALITTRGILSVPGHFMDAILMGFFFSFYLFVRKKKYLCLALAFIVPVLAHGLYDFFLSLDEIAPIWDFFFSGLFFFTFFLAGNLSVKAIRTAKKLDDEVYSRPPKTEDIPSPEDDSALNA